MSEPWPFGTVVKINHKGLLDTPMSELPEVAVARVMVVFDQRVPSFSGIALVETPYYAIGSYMTSWARHLWEPVDE